MRPASRHGEDRAAADRDIRGKPGTSGCLTGNGRTADLQICYRTWLTLLLTDVELCDSQSGRTPLSRYGGPRSRSRTQSSRLLASASPISIPTSCPCSTRRSLHGNQPQVWASVRGGHAGCVHPAGPVPLVPLPPSRTHPCSPHTSVNTILAQLVFLGTHSPLSTGRESRGPRGNRRAHRPGPGPMRRARRVPARPASAPGPFSGSGPSRGPRGDSVRAARCKRQHGAARAQEMRV